MSVSSLESPDFDLCDTDSFSEMDPTDNTYATVITSGIDVPEQPPIDATEHQVPLVRGMLTLLAYYNLLSVLSYLGPLPPLKSLVPMLQLLPELFVLDDSAFVRLVL